MAEVGFWLHGAHGKLGGASLRKGADGKTIISEIVTPFNPRTNEQIYQRAIMATVMRAYSAGKEVFDHSFQGKSVGAANMAEFMKRNLHILRNLCAQEMNEIPWIHWGGAIVLPNCRARLVHYESLAPVGFDGMMISSGSYDQNFFKVNDAWAEFAEEEQLKFTIPEALTNETCAEYALRTSLVADDLYTICGFYPTGGFDMSSYYDDEYTFCGLQKIYSFFIIRMHVKPEFVSSSDAVANKKLDDIFLFEAPIGQFIINDVLLEKRVGDSFWMGDFYENFEIPSYENAWCNIIRSRVNEDLRSTTVLKQNCAWANVGIIPAYVLPVWYPDIKGEPYPNPPILPEPAAPIITAVPLELTPGTLSDVLGLQLNDGTMKPFLFNGNSVIRTGMLVDNVPTVSLMMMECQSVSANYTLAPDGTDGIPATLRVGACALDSSWVHTVIRIDASLYSMYSDELELPNMEFSNIKITKFHV